MGRLFHRIFCATDFSEPAEHAWQVAENLASVHRAEVVLVHAFVEMPTYPEVATGQVHAVWEEQRRWVQQALDQRAAAAEARGVGARGVILTGPPAEAIVDAAARDGADLLVVGTHGRTGLERVLIGSVAERIVRAAPCPVLVVRPTKSGGSSAGAA